MKSIGLVIVILAAMALGGSRFLEKAWQATAQQSVPSANSTQQSAGVVDDHELKHTELGISFPPVASRQQRKLCGPWLQELGVKRIRFAEQWKLREPLRGQFNWKPLDAKIDWATQNGFQVLLTIQSDAPQWAAAEPKNKRSAVFADIDAFKTYIAELLKRYPGKIARLQFGNEWQSEYWYAGSAEAYTIAANALYDTVQDYAPQTPVVLGGFTTISLRFLAAQSGRVNSFFDDEGHQYTASEINDLLQTKRFVDAKKRIEYVLEHARYDWLDVHLYDDPEQWGHYVAAIDELTDKKIICTEFGGPNLRLESNKPIYQAKRLADYIRTIDNLSIDEAYFFKLVEGTKNRAHLGSGLIDGDSLRKKPSFEVFKSFVKE